MAHTRKRPLPWRVAERIDILGDYTMAPITAQQAHTKLIRLEDDLRAFMGRLEAAGFEQAAREVAFIADYCLDPVRNALEQ